MHPNDRRKIRFGLKSIVDFIIQLNLHNLIDLLTKPDPTVQRFTTRLDYAENTHFADDSFFGLLKLANPTECRRLHLILKRIISNMHFSLSKSGFLASESVIEAAKIVVTEAVKRGPDLGSFLRGGSFASCVQVYRNLSSQFDYDSDFFFFSRIKSPTNSQNNNPKYNKVTREFPYPAGFCYKFQLTNLCSLTGCQYKHICSFCASKNHGAESCNRLGSARRNRQNENKENHH